MTIKEIAQLCGVSRGTVDRVINGRGKVKQETEQLILRVLNEKSYQKNIAGRALTIRKTAPMIGVVVSSLGNPFFDEVLLGMRQAQSELSDYGATMTIRALRGYDVASQLALIAELRQMGMAALVIQPINDDRVRDQIDELVDSGVPVVTVNTDIERSHRSCYIGSDYLLGGKTAAGLMGLVTGGEARLGVITGVDTLLGHVQRLYGFETHLTQRFPMVRIVARACGQDDEEICYSATIDMLKRNPEIDSLMIIAAGTDGVCRAVRELGLQDKVKIVAFDAVPQTQEMMRMGLIRAVVCQQPYEQGYRAVRCAFDQLLTGHKPSQDAMIMENQIRIVENL